AYDEPVIDFQNASVFKLSPLPTQEGANAVAALLIQDEQVLASFKTVRDMVVFTNKRVIAINSQGLTGRKKDFTSLPYAKVQAFSVETAGTFDLDSELELWFSGL